MPTEWLALGSSLPWALCGTHFACSAVRPAIAVFIGVNHSALSWLLWSSAQRAERKVTGVGDGDGVAGVCAMTLRLAETSESMLSVSNRCMRRIVAHPGRG